MVIRFHLKPQGRLFFRPPASRDPISGVGLNDAQRVGILTLIAGTVASEGTEPICPKSCADNRVMLVDQNKNILDPAVERAILRCLHRDPSQRPRSALSVAAALSGSDPLPVALAAGETFT